MLNDDNEWIYPLTQKTSYSSKIEIEIKEMFTWTVSILNRIILKHLSNRGLTWRVEKKEEN